MLFENSALCVKSLHLCVCIPLLWRGQGVVSNAKTQRVKPQRAQIYLAHSPERAQSPCVGQRPTNKNHPHPKSPERATSIAHTLMTPFQGLIWILFYERRALPYAEGCKGFALIIARHCERRVL